MRPLKGVRHGVSNFEPFARSLRGAASGPIFIRERAQNSAIPQDTVPELSRTREVETLIARLLRDERADYLHVHLARAGCYMCRVDRT